jgi:hypothetical protein
MDESMEARLWKHVYVYHYISGALWQKKIPAYTFNSVRILHSVQE